MFVLYTVVFLGAREGEWLEPGSRSRAPNVGDGGGGLEHVPPLSLLCIFVFVSPPRAESGGLEPVPESALVELLKLEGGGFFKLRLKG